MSTSIYWGEATLPGTPSYWKTAEVASDGGVPFGFRSKSNPFQPDALGGEAVFKWAFLQLSHLASVTLRVTPIIDGSTASVVASNGTVEVVPAIITLSQATGERRTEAISIPLVRRLVNPLGGEVSRWFVRGQRIQLLVESTGNIGAGGIGLDGVEVDYQIVRKANYSRSATVAA